jgi:hypothetical protein
LAYRANALPELSWQAAMGQAKNSRRLSQRLLSDHPNCCFCGGGTNATSVDHVPPKIVFWGKRRPAGLEVPACRACNQGTRKLDQVAGIFSRILVDSTPPPDGEAEFERILGSVARDFPGWQRESVPSPAQVAAFGAQFGSSTPGQPANIGPLATDALNVVGAKLGFALHYQFTKTIVPPGGIVNVRFETNASLPPRGLPAELTKHLGPAMVLKQGTWTTDGHFAFRSVATPDGTAGVYLAHVGRAFLTTSFVFCDGRVAPAASRSSRTFRPGDLQHVDATAMARYKA